jgi:hypothetical protein
LDIGTPSEISDSPFDVSLKNEKRLDTKRYQALFSSQGRAALFFSQVHAAPLSSREARV